MRYLFSRFALVLLLAVCCIVARPAEGQKINLPNVTRTKWSNGIRVVLMEYRRAPTITISAILPGGRTIEPSDKVGSFSMMTELLTKGTANRTAPQIAEQVDYLGGSLGASSDDDAVTVGLNVLSKDLDAGLELMADVMRNPSFPTEELERQRALSISGLQSLGEDPRSIASYVLPTLQYKGHPYGVRATITSLKNLSREDIVDAYQRVFSPKGMILVAVGDFKASELEAKLKAKFGDMPGGTSEAPMLKPVPVSSPFFLVIDKPDATQTQVRFIRSAYNRTSPEEYPASLANTILGGGFTSRLVDEIRVNKSLTYGIGSGFANKKAGGHFQVSTFTKVESTRAILEATMKVLQDSAEKGLTEKELQKVKGFISGQFAISVQTPEIGRAHV